MGMDVYGEHPRSEVGKYFRASVWCWHPLWEFCQDNSSLTEGVVHGHSNAGDGLNDSNSVALAEELEKLISDGTAEQWIKERQDQIDALPDETCTICKGTGTRDDQYVKGPCNLCNGTGKEKPFQAMYGTSVEQIKEFAAFLKDCGGFRIC